MSIIIPVLVLGGLGLLFGAGLALAAKFFCRKQDGLEEKILPLLPGANCGACGMPGCIAFTQALIQGKCSVDKCKVSRPQARNEIMELLRKHNSR